MRRPDLAQTLSQQLRVSPSTCRGYAASMIQLYGMLAFYVACFIYAPWRPISKAFSPGARYEYVIRNRWYGHEAFVWSARPALETAC